MLKCRQVGWTLQSGRTTALIGKGFNPDKPPSRGDCEAVIFYLIGNCIKLARVRKVLNLYGLWRKCRRAQPAFLSVILLAERICAQNQTGDGKKKVEGFNNRHAYHLRFCIESARRKPPRRRYLPTDRSIPYKQSREQDGLKERKTESCQAKNLDRRFCLWYNVRAVKV